MSEGCSGSDSVRSTHVARQRRRHDRQTGRGMAQADGVAEFMGEQLLVAAGAHAGELRPHVVQHHHALGDSVEGRAVDIAHVSARIVGPADGEHRTGVADLAARIVVAHRDAAIGRLVVVEAARAAADARRRAAAGQRPTRRPPRGRTGSGRPWGRAGARPTPSRPAPRCPSRPRATERRCCPSRARCRGPVRSPIRASGTTMAVTGRRTLDPAREASDSSATGSTSSVAE